MTNERGKSDHCVVPTKLSNKPQRRWTGQAGPYAGTKVETPDTDKGTAKAGQAMDMDLEAMEERRWAKGNTAQQTMHRTQSRASMQHALGRVREAARRNKRARFTALLHHVTVERLEVVFFELKKNAAPGVDGVTWEHYARDLRANLQVLHARVHKGAYRAKPSREVFIPKADGRSRPLGIASLEDKVVQRAVVGVLEAIYEVDFLGFSYGFRPGRSQHDALDALTVGILRNKVNWVLDLDISRFFETINHAWMYKFIEHRIGDKRILRLIRKWLSAGVMEGDQVRRGAEGTPQGAVISPILANIYLHYVLDLWVQDWRKRHASGKMIVVRYADDAVVGFQHERDARRFRRELEVRLQRFGLELHPEKTRLIEFGWYAARDRARRNLGKPETFEFLGFTHICGKTRSGSFLLLRHTSKKRMRAKLRQLRQELMRRRHLSIRRQGCWLNKVVRGYLNYHAIPTNSSALQQFHREVARAWLRALRQRSQRDRTDWSRMNRLLKRWLPRARIQHPWPTDRFDAKTRGGSPVR